MCFILTCKDKCHVAHGHTHEKGSVCWLTTEQYSLLVSTSFSCCHVTWCQRMLSLCLAAAQSRLLPDVSLSSLHEMGLLPSQSLLKDWTFSLSMSRLALSVSAADQCFWKVYSFTSITSGGSAQTQTHRPLPLSDWVHEPCQQWRINSLHPSHVCVFLKHTLKSTWAAAGQMYWNHKVIKPTNPELLI